jgi:hypothetical protein
LKIHEAGIPVFPTPERAMRGIGAAFRAGRHNRLHPRAGAR